MPRGHTLPMEVHLIIVRLSDYLPKEEISVYTGIPLRTVERILAYFHLTGTIKHLDPARIAQQPTSRRQLSDLDIQCLFGVIDRNPDLYLDELQEVLSQQCGKDVSKSTIWRALSKGGFTMKKITRMAAERSVELRREYAARISRYEGNQLVFVDESAVDRRTSYRGRAWSISGTQAQRKAFFNRGRRFSVLPAISLTDGIIHCNIREGTFRSDSFKAFILGLLDHMQPFPANNSVIVMDNCKIHKREDILEAIYERGMLVEFLPPYSPDYNPIELAFSAMKYHLRRNGDWVRMTMTQMSDEELILALLDALYIITPQDCEGWYRHCGYIH